MLDFDCAELGVGDFFFLPGHPRLRRWSGSGRFNNRFRLSHSLVLPWPSWTIGCLSREIVYVLYMANTELISQ